MAKRGNIFRCEVCGHVIQVHHEGGGTLVCCNQPMVEMKEKSKEEGLEKHVPIIEFREDKIMVSVGDVLHPMEENHYIEFVELIIDEERYIQYLKPRQDPIVAFKIPDTYEKIEARAYCNVHGLWSSEEE